MAEVIRRPRCGSAYISVGGVQSGRLYHATLSPVQKSPAAGCNTCRVLAQLRPWHGAQDGLERLHVGQRYRARRLHEK